MRKSKSNHEWSKNDTILSLYYTKFGNKGLYLKTEEDIAKFIGTSSSSLKMQSANIRAIMGQTKNSLSDYSQIQLETFNEYNGMSEYELRKVVKDIINQDEVERVEILKKMGKDPSKLKMVNN